MNSQNGIKEAVEEAGHDLLRREKYVTPEEKAECFAKQTLSDVYLMSTNAITLDGELVNIDGFANRVSFLCYGPENVLVVAGMNKVVTDVETGMKRVRDIASPPNAVRLNKNTPCAKNGRCGDCYTEDCICSQIVVTRRSGVKGRIKVILVGEDLGY